jgi:hypothetical protein
MRKRFWEGVEAKLEALNLDPATLVAIESKIAGLVPKPVQDDLNIQEEQSQRVRERLMGVGKLNAGRDQ